MDLRSFAPRMWTGGFVVEGGGACCQGVWEVRHSCKAVVRVAASVRGVCMLTWRWRGASHNTRLQP